MIINVPSITTNIIISLINLLIKYYNITIIKPFAIYIQQRDTWYVKIKNKDNKNTFRFVKECLIKINESKYDEYIINIDKIEYFYLKQIIHDNSIWGTYVLIF